MKILLAACSLLAPAILLAAEPAPGKAVAPKGPLNASEQKLVGKWKGMRSVYRWEIERKADRTFEIAFSEPDPDDPKLLYENYATGVWWIEGDQYHFEWLNWKGDEGDFAGLITEVLDRVDADRVVTLTEGDDHPRNIETRVEKFVMKAWRFKAGADNKEVEAGKPEATQ